MARPDLETGKKHTPIQRKTETDTSLKGTLLSVFGLGLFIVISWLSVFALYLSRS
ncbi:hypothetical protein CathTA2_0361 [Caldalkalibacillus thermarum TA2.A1]|uniref:Cytochrome c oxidase subunit 2A n=1 Tax=Caldalkalibacillus thermarum (strain TA2.A1) TaxID=986075 RepID=F5L3K2_CALTT|nr:cytochrome c oxidase subunit 2A [Caldalkalibacillus thermarum]EGL84078.1 hypothetical protein CathTA2_0361 [Caldalkalibacillus thermarum TA2.A1]QZT33450.1 cytochrome c oxidase subunit 2A [Caldalkalibacillus thermarum TA2.A1]